MSEGAPRDRTPARWNEIGHIVSVEGLLAESENARAVLSHLAVHSRGFGASVVVHFARVVTPPQTAEEFVLTANANALQPDESDGVRGNRKPVLMSLRAAYSGGGLSDLFYWAEIQEPCQVTAFEFSATPILSGTCRLAQPVQVPQTVSSLSLIRDVSRHPSQPPDNATRFGAPPDA